MALKIPDFVGISSCRIYFSICITSFFLILQLFSLVGVSNSVVSLSCRVSYSLLCCNIESISLYLVVISSFRNLFSVSRSFILWFSFSFSPSCWLMVCVKFLSNLGSISFPMLVISSFKFSIFKTVSFHINCFYKLNSSFKDSSLVIQSHLLMFRFSTEVMLSDIWCSIQLIVISLSDAVWFGSSELICSLIKLSWVSLQLSLL